MFKTGFLVSLTVCLAAAFTACGSGEKQNEQTDDSAGVTSLVISCDETASPGITQGGDIYGYSYELLSAYARSKGYELKLDNKRTMPGSANNKADIIISQRTAADLKNYISEPLYSTNYVILTSSSTQRALRKNKSRIISSSLNDWDIYAVSGFQYTDDYDTMLDTLKKSRIYVSADNSIELAKKLNLNRHSLFICEKNEAAIIMELAKNIAQVYEFDEAVQMNLLFPESNRELQKDFRQWYMGFQTTDEYAALEGSYLGDNGFSKQYLMALNASSRNSPVGTISKWDDLLKYVGERENVDWRLLSAIAYHESRFKPDVVSNRGARGLMQIMPIVADNFKVSRDKLYDPETNITVAAKLLKSIEKTLKFSGPISDSDKMSIILAAYNCGIGHVTTARKLAANNGENINSWKTVSEYLSRMGDAEFVESVNINRPFNGANTTLAYVDNVINKYRSYCVKVKR